jgi:hypothetical protein
VDFVKTKNRTTTLANTPIILRENLTSAFFIIFLFLVMGKINTKKRGKKIKKKR